MINVFPIRDDLAAICAWSTFETLPKPLSILKTRLIKRLMTHAAHILTLPRCNAALLRANLLLLARL